MADYFRIRSMMEEQDLDALLILGNRNCAYLASGVGDEPWFNEPHGLAAWMILLAPPDKSFILGGGDFSEIDMPIERIQGDQNRDARLQIVADRIKSAKLDRGRIGVDMDYMPNSDMAKLSGLLPNVRFETADSLMARARARKTPVELEWIKKSIRASEKGYGEVKKHIKPGASFNELCNIWAKTVIDNGSLPVYGAPNRFMYGEAGKQKKGDAVLLRRPAKVEAGCVYRFDFSCLSAGYFSDQKFNFSVGKPSDEQMAIWMEHRDRQIFMEDLVRPGMTKRQVFEACSAEFRNVEEYTWWLHSVGVEVHEEPQVGSPLPYGVNVRPEVTYEENNVSALEASWLIEDLYVLRKGGFERLGTVPQEVTIF